MQEGQNASGQPVAVREQVCHVACAALEQQSLALWVGGGVQGHHVAQGEIAKIVPFEGASVGAAHDVGSVQLVHAHRCVREGLHDLVQAPSVVAVPVCDCRQAEEPVMRLHQKKECGCGSLAAHRIAWLGDSTSCACAV